MSIVFIAQQHEHTCDLATNSTHMNHRSPQYYRAALISCFPNNFRGAAIIHDESNAVADLPRRRSVR